MAWLVSEKVREVKLRPGVKYHNGEPFDASAVKFSFERINRADFKSPQKGWFSTIERAEVVDPLTVRFHTKVPDPAMPARMTLMYQVAPRYVAQVGDVQANLKPVGTGPFLLRKEEDWQRTKSIVLHRNQQYREAFFPDAGGETRHEAAGRRIPADVAVGGFDDSKIATATSPRLTTIHHPLDRISAEMVRLLLARIGGEPPSAVLLPTDLVIRDSA